MFRSRSFLRWFFESSSHSIKNDKDLSSWLSSQSSHITQSSMYAYTRARLGLLATKAFKEEIFSQALYLGAATARLYIMADLALLMSLYFSRAYPKIDISLGASKMLEEALKIDNLSDNAKLSPPKDLDPALKDLSFILPISPSQALEEANSHFDMLLSKVVNPLEKDIQAKDIAKFSAEKLFVLTPLTHQVKHLDKHMVINNTVLRMMRFYEDVSRSEQQRDILNVLSKK